MCGNSGQQLMTQDETKNSKILGKVVCKVKIIISANALKLNMNDFRIIYCTHSFSEEFP